MNPFDYNETPTVEMLQTMRHLRDLYKSLADHIGDLPTSRERALAMTNLEQAAMWTNKAVTHGPPSALTTSLGVSEEGPL